MRSEVGSDAYRVVGEPRFGGVLIVSDHASNRVPADIDLGIDPALLTEHVAIDIGVAEVAVRMARTPGIAAFLGNVSRLVCDFNREEDAPAVIPHASDGHAIPGNLIDVAGREARLARGRSACSTTGTTAPRALPFRCSRRRASWSATSSPIREPCSTRR